jgi:PleD family two-component response regulator
MYNYSYNKDIKYNCKECNEYETQYISKKKLNILIVDADDVSSSSFKTFLVQRGHNVNSLNNGISCILNCQTNKYDVIFLDYNINDIKYDQLVDFLKDIYKIKSLIVAYINNSNLSINNNLLKLIMDSLEKKVLDIKSLKQSIERKYKSSIILFE